MKSGKPTVRPSSTSRKSRKLTRATAAVFEQMEPRRLMSGTLTIAPNSGNDQIVLDVAANGGIIKTVNGVQTTYSPGQWTDVLVDSFQNGEPLTIRATTVPVHISAGQPVYLTIGGPQGLQKINAMVTLDGGSAGTINLNDTGNNAARNSTIGTNAYGQIEIKNFAPAIINLSPTGVGVMNLTTGGGADTVTLYDTPANSSVNINSAGGTDTVSVGADSAGTGGILGAVTINNTPSLTHLVLDDSYWDEGFNMLVSGDGTNDSIIGMTQSPVTYKVADVADVTLKLPYGGSTVSILSTDKPLNIVGKHPGLFFHDDFVIGGAQGMTTIKAPITISEPNSVYDIDLKDQNDPNARLIQVDSNPNTQMSSVTGMGGAPVQWEASDGAGVTLNTSHVGGNGVVVRNVNFNALITIKGSSPLGGPNDVVTLGDGGSVQGIAAPVIVRNTGYTNLTIDDSADPVARNASLDIDNTQPVYEWKLAGLAPASIYFDDLDVSGVTTKGGSGGNTFTLNNTLGSGGISSTPFNLFTGTGGDTVNVYGMMTGGVLNIEGQSGFDTVNCGQGGLTAGLRGTINVSNAAQYTQLIIDDSADTVSRAITLDAIAPLPGDTHPRGRITGIVPGTINYRAYDMKDPLTIKAGSGANIIVVNNTPVNTLGYVGGNTINLTTGIGADHLTIKALGAGTTLNIDGQSGADPVVVGNNGSVQAILGTVTLRNTLQWEDVTIDDSADAANRIVTIGVLNGVGDGDPLATITGLAPGVINFEANDVVNPTINGGSGANVYTFTGTPTSAANGLSGPTITLNAGSGADIISVVGMGKGTGLNINGQGADDSLSVDYSAGAIPLNSGIAFNGGASGPIGDAVHVKGAANSIFTATAGDIGRGGPGHLTYTNVQSLYCDAGNFHVENDLNLGALVAQSAATTVNFNATETIGKLFIDGAQTTMAPGGAISLALQTLNIVNAGRLDLADDGLLLTYGNGPDPVATIRGYLLSGYDNGKWDGAGIASSVAQNNPVHNTAIGYADSADGTGVNTTPNSIKLTYTLYGDASLDKTVDTLDFNSLAANFGGTGKGWTQADFNYDGKVDTLDFNNLAASFGKSLPAAPAAQANVFSSQRITSDFDAIAQEATSAVA